MSPTLKRKFLAAIPLGAVAISAALLGGHDGLEGRVHVPYRDVVGVLTVCDGHTSPDIVPGKMYTDSECDALLNDDIMEVKKTVDPLVTVQVPDTTRAALYTFAYNCGTESFRKSTLLKMLNAGNTVGACDQLRRWTFAGGKKWQGLMNRREVEREVCNWPVTA
ncbi:MAG: lysozyme [Ewingella sp.]